MRTGPPPEVNYQTSRNKIINLKLEGWRKVTGILIRPLYDTETERSIVCLLVNMAGEWRRLHNEELNDLYSSPNIVRVIKSRRMRWAGHVTRMGEERGAYRVLVGKPEGKRP